MQEQKCMGCHQIPFSFFVGENSNNPFLHLRL
jgi:hypothetical protein